MTTIRVLEKEDLTKDILEIRQILLNQARKTQKELQQARKNLEVQESELKFTSAATRILGGQNKLNNTSSIEALNTTKVLIRTLEEKLNLLFRLFSDHDLDNYIKELEKEYSD